jgi:DNA-binding transcriptional regulator GbsR (MarR family)
MVERTGQSLRVGCNDEAQSQGVYDSVSQSDFEKTREDFIETIGMIVQADGFPRISGRMFGLLVFDGGAHAFGDLAHALQVSRGSISSSARLLEEQGLIRRVSKPGQRQDYFEVAENPYQTLLKRFAQRAETSRERIAGFAQVVCAENPEICQRLQDYAQFFDTIRQCTETACDRLNSLKEQENA